MTNMMFEAGLSQSYSSVKMVDFRMEPAVKVAGKEWIC